MYTKWIEISYNQFPSFNTQFQRSIYEEWKDCYDCSEEDLYIKEIETPKPKPKPSIKEEEEDKTMEVDLGTGYTNFVLFGGDFAKFKEIADEVGAYLMVDMAHIAGLVAAGIHPSPVPYADVVTSTTHKTLRGPRGGMILCKEEFAKAIDKAVFPGTQGGPLMHVIAAKAVAFGEALKPEFKEYGKRIISNCKALENSLCAQGIDMVSGGSDNHLLLLDLRSLNITGKELEHRLDNVYITTNKNSIPNDPEKPFVTSGIRVGTAAVSTRGFGAHEMIKIAEFIKLAATDYENNIDYIRNGVTEICNKYPLY